MFATPALVRAGDRIDALEQLAAELAPGLHRPHWLVLGSAVDATASDTDYRNRPTPATAADRLVAELSPGLDHRGTLLVLDLPAVLGVQVAARLCRRGLAHPLLMLPRWPVPDAFLPSDELVAALLFEARGLRVERRLPHLAVVLDGERERAQPGRPAGDARVDNRARLALELLPTLAALRAAGIQRIQRLVWRRAPGTPRSTRPAPCAA
jgi:hypothetical protein